MDDQISRQAAYEVLTAYYHHATDVQHAALHDALSKVPSAERHGRWVVLEEQIENQTFDECKCSECGCVEYFNKGWKHFNYCPNCGALMNGE